MADETDFGRYNWIKEKCDEWLIRHALHMFDRAQRLIEIKAPDVIIDRDVVDLLVSVAEIKRRGLFKRDAEKM